MDEFGKGGFSGLMNSLGNDKDFLGSLLSIREFFGVDHAVYHLAPFAGTGAELPFVRATYSPQWIIRYIKANYVAIDPVVQCATVSANGFFWSDIDVEGAEIEAFFLDALQHGVGNCGYTHPVVDRSGNRAIFTLNSQDDPRAFQERLAPMAGRIAELALILHNRALAEPSSGNPARRLSRRETECLNWIARGKDAASIAEILHISEHTVRDYLKSARTKLACSTIAQAVYEATRLNLINP
ncbi:MAG: LuxR family transcriptional regulator [Nitratireductor sp.]|jgi:DNA-binding CsgD family transcriptional regulator|nr:LuxR family transcriptional regulator [Nitratireductor sp.]